jgi:putative tryptophan/tyrosine transport system substrate-binding protein
MPQAADDPEYQARVAAFFQGLQELGWSIGRNVRVEYRWGAGDPERIRKYAAELAALAPDIILATGASTVGPLLRVTRTVPIVFVTTIDPVGSGFVASLALPGGNATGFTAWEFSLSGKLLELLKEIAPRVTRVAVIRDPFVQAGSAGFAAIQTVAPSFGVELTPIGVRDADEVERGIAAFAHGPNDGLIGAAIIGADSSRLDHYAGCPAPAARGLLLRSLRHLRWPGLLWDRSNRPVPARRRLRRSHSSGCEAGRPSGTGAD